MFDYSNLRLLSFVRQFVCEQKHFKCGIITQPNWLIITNVECLSMSISTHWCIAKYLIRTTRPNTFSWHLALDMFTRSSRVMLYGITRNTVLNIWKFAHFWTYISTTRTMNILIYRFVCNKPSQSVWISFSHISNTSSIGNSILLSRGMSKNDIFCGSHVRDFHDWLCFIVEPW